MHLSNKLALTCLAIMISNMVAMEQGQEEHKSAPITRPSFDDFKPVPGSETFTVSQSSPGFYKAFENGTKECCGDLWYQYGESTIKRFIIMPNWQSYAGPITAALITRCEKEATEFGNMAISLANDCSLTPFTYELLKQHGFTLKNGLYTKRLVTVRPVNKKDLADPKIKAYFKAQSDLKNLSDSTIDLRLEEFHTKKTEQDEKGSKKCDGLAVSDKNSIVRALALYQIGRNCNPNTGQLWIRHLIDLNPVVGPAPIETANHPLCVLLETLETTAQKEVLDEILYIMPKDEDKKIKNVLKECDFKEKFLSGGWWSKKP